MKSAQEIYSEDQAFASTTFCPLYGGPCNVRCPALVSATDFAAPYCRSPLLNPAELYRVFSTGGFFK